MDASQEVRAEEFLRMVEKQAPGITCLSVSWNMNWGPDKITVTTWAPATQKDNSNTKAGKKGVGDESLSFSIFVRNLCFKVG